MLQTFVQSVVPGSVSFLAGLYPGDAIIEVNGVDVKYAPVEDVVKRIHEGAETGARWVEIKSILKTEIDNFCIYCMFTWLVENQSFLSKLYAFISV